LHVARFGQGRPLIVNFKTVFPPLLIELQHHVKLLAQVVDAALSGASATTVEALCADYWQRHERADAGQLSQLTPELQVQWQHLGTLHDEFLQACNACVEAAARGDNGQAKDRLDQAFALSAELVGVLVGTSMQELGEAFSAHEAKLAARYEHDFMEAARIGRFAVRLADNCMAEADDSFLALLGFTQAEVPGLDMARIIDAKGYQRILKAARGKDINVRVTVKAKHRDGRKVALEVVAYIEQGSGGGMLQCVAADISHSQAEMEQRRLLSTAIEVSDHVVMITNAEQEIVYVNPAFTRLTGYDVAEALGRSPRFLQGPETSQSTRVAMREALAAGRRVHVEILNYTKEGLRYWADISIVPVTDDSGEITHFIALEHDVTERKAAEQAIVRIALEDHLTGLPNRRAAEDRIEMEWNRARRNTGGFALAIVDIDRFKLVNDQHGHHVGDQALKHVSDVLARHLRRGDWVARWGGEEFLLCFHDLDSRGAHIGAERMRKLVKSNPLKMQQAELPLTVSMGVSVYNPEHDNLDSMLAQADALLYEAKHSGRDKVLCSGRADARRGSVLWEGSQVQGALHEGRIVPVYQPIVDLRSGAIVADEALARIRARDDSLVPAANFIEAAEALHLVASIDKTISTCALGRCSAALLKPGKTSGRSHFINLSHQFLANAEQVDSLLVLAQGYCGQVGNGKSIVIEITERQSGDILTLKKNLQPLTDFGFRLALDDFGSGYSSFLYLAELPVDFLKIEGWMVSRINQSDRVRQLVETLVNTARKLGVTTIAECVEDAETAQVLCDIGVDWAQGYYFARPAEDSNCGK
jgi:diguanylate cyclase (GGDEF)-like protein/PAS domain S-box-containing protein